MEAKLSAIYDLGQKLVLLRDVQQIAETVLDFAARVLDFQDGDFLLVDAATNELYVIARCGQLQAVRDLRLHLDGKQGITVAAAQSGRPIYVPDVRQDPRYVYAGFAGVSELALPVQIEGRVLGVLNFESDQVDAFNQADQELLGILTTQVALALENAQLYAREHHRAEEMLAINKIAQRINASLDLQETFDAIVRSAAELVPCSLAEISLWDKEQELLVLQALRCIPERTFPIGHIFPPGEGYTGWVVRHKRPLLVPDVEAYNEVHIDLMPGELPLKAYVGLPLLSGDEFIGTLVLIHDQAGAFDQDDLRLLETLAGQASTAVRNARLFEESQRKAHRLAALNTIANVINLQLPLQDIMDRAITKIVEVMEADISVIRLLDPMTNELVIASSLGLRPEYLHQENRIRLTDEDPVSKVVRSGEALIVVSASHDPRLASLSVTTQEFQAFALVPLKAKASIVGTLGVAHRESRDFHPEEIDLLTAIGHQIGVAIENARLRQEALAAERLAAVGRVATSVAHDLRSPLGGIIRSAEFLARPELSQTTRKKLSQAIVSLSRRLINTSQQILDFVHKERLPLNCVPCVLSEFLESVLAVLEVDFSERGIEVIRDCHYRGEVVMDPDRMAQVVYNIAANARDAMQEGGTFTVSSRKVDHTLELRFSDTGPGVPEEFIDRIFEPFFTYGKREGAGLGLAIARRIVEEHGGSIHIESQAGEGATFVVTLPLLEPEND